MDECKPIKIPMPSNRHFDRDEGGKSVDQTLYHSMIGSLLYLTSSRPNIMFSVCMCASFQTNPKEAHLVAAKRILRYLKHASSASFGGCTLAQHHVLVQHAHQRALSLQASAGMFVPPSL